MRIIKKIKKDMSRFIAKTIDEYCFTNFFTRFKEFNSKLDFQKNDYLVEKDTIVFIHIEKTGGTTFRKILDNIERKGLAKFKKDVDFPVSIISPPTNNKYVTIIRNPIDTVYSYYNQQLINETQPYTNAAKNGLITLLKTSPRCRNNFCQYYSGFINEDVDERIFNIAYENLKNFYAIIDFDSFENDIKKFCNQLNYDYGVENIPRENKSNYVRKKEDHDIEMIKFYNYYDVKLFDLIKKYLNN
tara:strand:+ start:1316 stop:2047 length:732 start_codon:yes stop_codon:yes gene_type:complete